MKRAKSFGEILRYRNFKFLYLFGFAILMDNFQLTTSQITQSDYGDEFELNEIEQFLVGRQISNSDDQAALTCQYRNLILSEDHFAVWATYGCYIYTRTDLKVNPLAIGACVFNGVALPVVNLNNTCEFKFSINDPAVQKAMLYSFANNQNVYNRWLSCSQDAIDCCANNLLGVSSPKDGYCSPVWDGWTCFTEYARAGEDEEMPCSKYAYSGTPPQCTHYSTKTCFSNSTWNDTTNYATCGISARLVTRTQWHISMLSISIIVSFPGLLILLVYKQLYTQKYAMIRNLIIAITCRNILVLISKSTIIMDELTNTNTTTIMANNGAGCRTLTFFEKMAANFVFTCMLLEGIYLHQLLTNVFGTRRNAGVVKMLYYYIGGSFISISTALIWSILMAVLHDSNCWTVTDGNDLHWINDSPRLAMLLINTILLVHIVIVMWKAFRSKSNEDNPGWRTAKASLICLPLFGVPFLLVVFRPATESCGWEQFYYFVSYALEGLQCISVVLSHCYFDREVQRLVKRSFIVLKDNIHFGKTKKRRSKYEDRRTTYSTYADSRPNNGRPTISSPVPLNGENNLKSQNVLVLPAAKELNTTTDNLNSPTENCPISDVSRDQLYDNLPPLRDPIVTRKDERPNDFLHSLSTAADTNDNNTNGFFVNDDHENMFDYYYNDRGNSIDAVDKVEPPFKKIDDVKLDPKLFFKNRANGIQFVDNNDDDDDDRPKQ